MIRVYVICEGQTEETFVKELLISHFSFREIFLSPILIGKAGGNVRFDRLCKDVKNLLLGDPESYCTTFFDFYGLPAKFPGKSEATSKVKLSEKKDTVCTALKMALKDTIGKTPMRRFIPYVQMYEFEGLLFSDPLNFANGIGKPELQRDFNKMLGEFDSPEHINDHLLTAPSKRIKCVFAEYEKPLMGTLAAIEIGLPKIRQECPLFDDWLKKLESLPPLQ